ncbi:MAG: FtsX-like permease family protein [Burkholderiaceae bacterium]
MRRWLFIHVIAGQARQHPLRLAVQVLAIALGVALGWAVHLINSSALAEFATAVRHVTGQADAAIAGPREGFDEAVYARALAHPDIEIASPVLEIDAVVIGGPRDLARERASLLPVIGLDTLRAGRLGASLLPLPAGNAGRNALFDDGLYLSPAALAKFGVKVGASITVQAGGQAQAIAVVGTVPGARAGEVVALMDIAFAQSRFARLGQLTRIDLKLAAGAANDRIAASLDLPAGVAFEASDARSTRVSNLSRAYRVNLNVLAMVALFTGAFLVFSLQAQASVTRRPQLAFLRVMGVTHHELLRLLLLEAIAVGTAGSLLGLAGGLAVAQAALSAFGGDLGGGFFAGARPALVVEPRAALLFFALGLAAAMAGSLLPARAAAATPPAAALKAGAASSALPTLAQPRIGLLLIGLAALLAGLPAVGGIALAGYLAIVALLVGAIALQPALARAVFVPLAARAERGRVATRAPILWLALTRLAQAPGFAAIGMAGIVASFALMVAMATMISSFRSSVDDWLVSVLPAELYARAAPAGSSGFFSAQDLAALRSHPGVARVDFTRFAKLSLAPERAPVTLIVRNIDAANPAQSFPLAGESPPWNPQHPPPVWVSEAVVALYGAAPGATIVLPIAGQEHRFTVQGVWRDYARQFGAIAMRDIDYQRLSGDSAATDAAIWLAPGWSAQRLAQDLLPRLDARSTEFIAPGAIRAASLKIFDRSFAVTYLLEAAAILIGLTGIAATFSAQAIARSREFGMLRHLGLTRGEVLRLLGWEGLLVTLLALAVGLVTGLAVALILIAVVNPQSFHWTMEFHAPVALLATLITALVAAATLTAVFAGRRATAREAVLAVRQDW